MDSELPGIVCRPIGAFRSPTDSSRPTLTCCTSSSSASPSSGHAPPPPPPPRRTNWRGGGRHRRGLEAHAGFLDRLSLKGGGRREHGGPQEEQLDGWAHLAVRGRVHPARRLGRVDATPPGLLPPPTRGRIPPAPCARSACPSPGAARLPPNIVAAQLSRGVCSGLSCLAPVLGPHGLMHGRRFCRTRCGGHSILEVIGHWSLWRRSGKLIQCSNVYTQKASLQQQSSGVRFLMMLYNSLLMVMYLLDWHM